MFPLFETIKVIDGIPQNLRYHKMRFEKSYFLYYRLIPQYRFPEKFSIPDDFSGKTIKLRLTYNKENFKTEYSLYKRKRIKTLKCIYDDNIDYSIKYSDRSQISNLLKLKEDNDDILIIKNGFITDSSYTNIVFYDGNKWYTPSTPLLPGTTRERLIEKEIIVSAPIKYSDLQYFKKFKLVNAMIDFDEAEVIDISNISL